MTQLQQNETLLCLQLAAQYCIQRILIYGYILQALYVFSPKLKHVRIGLFVDRKTAEKT